MGKSPIKEAEGQFPICCFHFFLSFNGGNIVVAVSFTSWFDLHMVGFISFLFFFFFQLSAAFDCRCALKLRFHGIPSGQMVYFRPHSLI